MSTGRANAEERRRTRGRRRVLRALGAGALVALAGCSGGSDASEGGGPYGSWLADANAFESVRDRTGESSIEIGVGTDGGLAFGPPAVRIAPGATVTWVWTGQGGAHNVHELDDAFESDLVNESGHTFEHTFDSAGVYRYVCDPHEHRGMKGVLEVVDQ